MMKISNELKELFCKRPLVVLGVGSELRGDDAWAYHLIIRLKKFVPLDVHCIWGATLPENFIKPIVKLKPAEVLICDAGGFNASPGTLRIFSPDNVKDEIIFSHRLPLKLLSSQIKERCNCPTHLLLMQPQNLEFSTELSPPIKKSVNQLIATIRKILV